MVLQPSQFLGVLVAQQVGSSGAAEEHRPSGEYPGSVTGVVAKDVADVMVRVARREQDLQMNSAAVDSVAVTHGTAGELYVLAGGNNVFGADCGRKRQA